MNRVSHVRKFTKQRRLGMQRAQRNMEAMREEKYLLGKILNKPGGWREQGGTRFSVTPGSLMTPSHAFALYVRRRLNTALRMPTPPPIRIYDGKGHLTALVQSTVTPEGVKLERRAATKADKKRYRRIVVD